MRNKDKLLKLWKIRQEAEGYDVSGVNTLEEAEHFFDKPEPVVEAVEIGEIMEEAVEPEPVEEPKKPKKKKV
jgi:hypothetical protein